MNYFLITFEHMVENELGVIEKKTSQYIFKCVNYTDAEISAIKFFEEEKVNSITIQKIKLHEVFYDKGEHWFKIVLAIIVYNEKTKKEKVDKFTYLVRGDRTEDIAKDMMDNHFGHYTNDFYIQSVSMSKIIDVVEFGNVQLDQDSSEY